MVSEREKETFKGEFANSYNRIILVDTEKYVFTRQNIVANNKHR